MAEKRVLTSFSGRMVMTRIIVDYNPDYKIGAIDTIGPNSESVHDIATEPTADLGSRAAPCPTRFVIVRPASPRLSCQQTERKSEELLY
jgi:hypothetical protein